MTTVTHSTAFLRGMMDRAFDQRVSIDDYFPAQNPFSRGRYQLHLAMDGRQQEFEDWQAGYDWIDEATK